MEAKFNFRGKEIDVKVRSNDKNWGKGLDLDFEFGGLQCKVGFNCHPEFDEFDKYNNFTHSELFECAVTKLSSGQHDKAIIDAANSGIRLLLVLNGENVT